MAIGKNCSICGSKELAKTKRVHHFLESGLLNVYLVDVDVLECRICGEEIVSIPRAPELMNCIAEYIITKPDLLTGREIRFLRKNLLLRINELAALLGVDRVTVSRWENEEKKPSRLADRLIRLLYAQETKVSEEAHQKLSRHLREQELHSRDYVWRISANDLACATEHSSDSSSSPA